MPPDAFETETAGATLLDLTRLGPDRLLVLFAGISAIGFGALALVLYLMGEAYPRVSLTGYSALGGAVFSFAVAAVFGLALLLSFGTMAARPAEGAILALAFSVVLLAFGALPGLIAGIVGLIGALTGIVRNLRFQTG
ncbi:MAG TPA: hypothetical protein VM582_03375 [Candidatus Thermoplasmatota archaeon]|nr:hypothetical protein [Candidatus Thermoplasmatota archaeon]